MTPIEFRQYGVNGTPVTIIAERVTHWREDSYNGRNCTEIHLDTGDVITVDAWSIDVAKKFSEATKGLKQNGS